MKTSSILLLFAAFVYISSSWGIDIPKSKEFITNGIYKATFDETTYGYLPHLTTGELHSAGDDQPLTYSGKYEDNDAYTSYFAVYVDGRFYNYQDLRQYHLGSIKTDPSTYTQVYTLPDVNGDDLTIIITTKCEGTTEVDSFISVTAEIIDNCANGNNTDVLRPKFRFLVDVAVGDDDGPIATTYNNGMDSIDQTSEFSVTADQLMPAAFSFKSSFEAQNANPAYRVFLLSRGAFVGADVVSFASWVNSATLPGYTYTPTGIPITATNLGNYDDSAALVYFDASSCGDGNGYRLTCGRSTFVQLRLFAHTISQSFPAGACPYCAAYALDADNDNIGDDMDPCTNNNTTAKAVCASRAQDWDNDGYYNPCDWCPWKAGPNDDTDGDEVGDICDNCYLVANADQNDTDTDGFGNVCDNCQFIYNQDQNDTDSDDVGDVCDNCLTVPNTNQLNNDSDIYGDACDLCPRIPSTNNTDVDGDLVGDICDNCPFNVNPNQRDRDQDGVGNVCDNCPRVYNPFQENADDDKHGDACDNCVDDKNDDQLDHDDDKVGDVCDNCPETPNRNQNNQDEDAFGDVCDNCPYVWTEDQLNSDDDPFGNACDVCPFLTDPDQRDLDGDGVGDACDNCKYDINPDQADSDNDHFGNACDQCKNSRYSVPILQIDGRYVPNIYLEDGCYLSDRVDECTVACCVSTSPVPTLKQGTNTTFAHQLY